MLSLDPTTRAEYDAAETPSARAAVVLTAITGTVTATVYDGSDVARGSGTMQTPWASIAGSRLVIGELADFLVTNGGTPDADWYLAFEAGGRWLRGRFGLSGDGADFTWSLPTFATGQGGRLGTVEVQAQGLEAVEGPYSAQWSLMTFAQASLSPSWSVANGSAQALDASGVPSPIVIYQGQTFDFADYVVGGVPPYSVALGSGSSLPLGVTKTGPTTLAAGSSAPVALSGDIVFDVDDSAVAATLPTFGVLSHVGGADLPFAFGHVFKQGDVPSGSFVDSDLTDWQCVPTTTWPDGSLRHAIIAGRATCAQNVRKDIALEVSATDRTGTTLTEANLAAVLPTVTIQGGSHTTTLNSLVGTAAKHRTVCTGPIMSNWIYRHAVASSNHLVVWIDVRLYKGGRVEIFPWVENAYLTVAGPTNDVRTWTVTIGGTQVFSQSIDIKHHTRVPLISGSAFSYWTGTDPQIVPKHDVSEIVAAKLLPRVGATANSSQLDALTQTYTPNTRADVPYAMGAAGGGGTLIGASSNHSAGYYIASDGDARAFKAVMVLGLSSGSWSIHYKDESTNEAFRFQDYPLISIQGGTPSLPVESGGVNGDAAVSHQPAFAYLPWLLTGRWFFIEEMLSWVTWNYMKANSTQRNGSDGRIDTSNGTYALRGAAWALRSLCDLAVCLPSDHYCYGDIINAIEKNAEWYEGRYVTGTIDGGTWVSPLGILGEYNANNLSNYPPYVDATYPNADGTRGTAALYAAAWMNNMSVGVWARMCEQEPPVSSVAKASMEAVRNHALKFPVMLGGDGSAGNWDYRRFAVYGMPYGTDGIGLPVDAWYTNGGDALAELQLGWGLAAPSGTALYRHTTNDAMTAANPSGPYFGFALTALSYAVDLGIMGADAAWGRVTGASNFADASTWFNSAPTYYVYPRSL